MEIERSIITKFRKGIYSKFLDAMREYSLVSPGDRIAVCISGGKDSFLLAKLMQEAERHGEVPYELEFMVMNPGYTEETENKIKENADILGIPLKIFSSNIFDISYGMDGEHPCYLCARMRRGFLYSKAKELGCNKIALGHHESDVIETTLIAMFFGGQMQGMMPKIKSTNFEGMELIRPMYKVLEKDIIGWANYNDLHFINCACKFSERAQKANVSAREDVKNLLKELCKRNPDVEKCIFKAIHNVDLDTFPSFRYKEKMFSFDDKYDGKIIMERKDDDEKL